MNCKNDRETFVTLYAVILEGNLNFSSLRGHISQTKDSSDLTYSVVRNYITSACTRTCTCGLADWHVENKNGGYSESLIYPLILGFF